MERIDKILASQNYGSRKQVHKLIKEKSVLINGVICTDSSQKVDVEKDVIEVNGENLNFKEHLYIMMNKPAGVLSASKDKRDKTVIDILPENLKRQGLFVAGRLDKDTEGLLIITDDGDFAHRITSPNKKVYKKYFAKLDNPVTEETKKKFENGIVFKDGTECLPAKLEICQDGKSAYVSICQGKFHQVKKMFLCCDLKVMYLKRVSIGKLELDSSLEPGQSREVNDLEKQMMFFV